MTDYEENNIPKDLLIWETLSVKKSIIYQQVKLYVMKEAEIKDNICKMYDTILVKCTNYLQIIIAQEKGYEEN